MLIFCCPLLCLFSLCSLSEPMANWMEANLRSSNISKVQLSQPRQLDPNCPLDVLPHLTPRPLSRHDFLLFRIPMWTVCLFARLAATQATYGLSVASLRSQAWKLSFQRAFGQDRRREIRSPTSALATKRWHSMAPVS